MYVGNPHSLIEELHNIEEAKGVIIANCIDQLIHPQIIPVVTTLQSITT